MSGTLTAVYVVQSVEISYLGGYDLGSIRWLDDDKFRVTYNEVFSINDLISSQYESKV